MNDLRKSTPVKIIMHYPNSDEGRQELARRVSDVHSDFAIRRIDKMNCPIKEKLRMLEAVAATRKGNATTPRRHDISR